MLCNNMDVNSQIHYAEIKLAEVEKTESTKNRLNVKPAGKAKLWGTAKIKMQFSCHI